VLVMMVLRSFSGVECLPLFRRNIGQVYQELVQEVQTWAPATVVEARIANISQRFFSGRSAPTCGRALEYYEYVLIQLQQDGVGEGIPWPSLRRVCMLASLYQNCSVHELWKHNVTRQIVRTFYARHRHNCLEQPIEFFHVSKAGGSETCELAISNGARVSSEAIGTNCLIKQFDDYPRWAQPNVGRHHLHGDIDFATRGPAQRTLTCGEREQFLNAHSIKFFAKEYVVSPERGLPPSSMCSQFCHFTTVREPTTRMVSHMNHILYGYHELHRGNFTVKHEYHTSFWCGLAPAVVDNYHVRVLNTEAVFNSTCGGVTAKQYVHARKMLLQFDVIVVLERANNSRLLTKYGLGWKKTYADKRLYRWTAPHELRRRALVPKLKTLMPINIWDRKLYKLSLLLQRLDHFFFLLASPHVFEQPNVLFR